MIKSNVEQKRIFPHITIVRRPQSARQQKVTPIISEENHEIRQSVPENGTLPPLVSSKDQSYSEEMKRLSIITTDETKVSPVTISTISKIVSRNSEQNNLTEVKKSSGCFTRWYSGLTPKQKTWFRVAIVVGVFLICAIIAILLVLFLIIFRSSSTSTTTTTTISTTVISASWFFDQTTADSYGIYNGTLMNGASYSPASSSQPYIGNGRALLLSAPSNQSFTVSAPFLNLSYTSFTIEAWVYLTNITGDRGIFSQCTCSTCSNQCFYLIVRASRLYADFTFNYLSGSTTLSTNTWYHIAFIYNYATNQQILYLNGYQDGNASNANPYQGTNGSILIGAAQLSYSICYFNGYIDNVKLTTRAKSSSEILFAASVTAYYPLDLSSSANDNGPNGLNGLLINTVAVKGPVNQAIRFTGSTSYFQAYGFYQFEYSISNKPFSFSFWINPLALSSSVIVQVAQQQNGTCVNFIGIASPSGTTGQLVVVGYYWPTIYGPFLTINTWTHVSVTYSSTNGLTLYVNGVLIGSTGSFTVSTSGYITWIQIGNNLACSGGISSNVYQGSIDELYIHSRELAQTEVYALANP